MFRTLHRWAGLSAALVLILVSLTGVILSVFPLLSADRTAERLNAGALIAAVQDSVPGAQQISIDDNGVVSASAFGDMGFQQFTIDPATGANLGPVETGELELWFENLHRDLSLSDTGQIVVLIASVAMLILSLSGYALAARRLGGWRKLFARDRGTGAGGWHLKTARIAGVGLLISAFTGIWMGAATLGLIPDPSPMAPFTTDLSTEAPRPADELAALIAIPGDSLRSVSLPSPDMAGQSYMVETDQGAGTVDMATGEMVTWQDRSGWSRAMGIIHLLHTGQGASLVGLLLGLASLTVPLLSGTGLLVWLKGRTSSKSMPSVKPELADTVLLVGSEGGSTWRFAKAFASELSQHGKQTHVAAMNGFAPERYARAESIVIFTATYGDGDAPESAGEFLERLAKLDKVPEAPLSVLGFGDSCFPAFCAYADEVVKAAEAKGWALMMAPHQIDTQSATDFEIWGEAYAEASGLPLGDLAGRLEARKTESLQLVAKSTYGEAAQAPTAVLRFARPKRTILSRLFHSKATDYQAGDLLHVLPEGDLSPRCYSLASDTHDGFLEICVRKLPGGRASGQLCNMEIGETMEAYVSRNAHFHAPEGQAPLVLIGAGAGIGALAGMVRANREARPAHLFFGLRSMSGGYPYEGDFNAWQSDGRLTDLTVALSRAERPRYVQQALQDEAVKLRDLISQGAHVMICGGREMGEGVRHALNEILAPLDMTVSHLEQEGRYAADVF